MVDEYALSIGSSGSPYIGEKVSIKDGELNTVRYVDMGTTEKSESSMYILGQQAGMTVTGIIGTAVIDGSTPNFAVTPALMIAGSTGLLAAGAIYLDQHAMRLSYMRMLQNAGGVQDVHVS